MSDNIIELNNIDSCCICLESDCQFLITLCCRQKIHKQCFIQWIITKGNMSTCPICRKEIYSIEQLVSVNDIYTELGNQKPLSQEQINNANSILSKYWSNPSFEVRYHDTRNILNIRRRGDGSCYIFCVLSLFIGVITLIFTVFLVVILKRI